MRIILTAGLLVAVALAFLAPLSLFATEEGTPTPAAPAAAPITEFQPASAELLDAGAEPRAALRYKFNKDLKEVMVMEMTIAMGMEVGGMEQPTNAMPTIRMVIALEGREITEEGDLKYGMEFTKIEVLATEDSDPFMVEGMETAMAGVVGLTGWGIVDNRGVTKDIGFTVPAGASPAVVTQLDQMRGQLNQLAAPLPEEAVGIGARWKVTQHIKSNGMTLTQEATYTLDEHFVDNVKMSLTVKQIAPVQNLQTPGLPPGTTVKLKFLESRGSGKLELDLNRLVPNSDMTVKMKMDAEISIEAPDMPPQSMPMGMKMQIDVKVRPSAVTETEEGGAEDSGTEDGGDEED